MKLKNMKLKKLAALVCAFLIITEAGQASKKTTSVSLDDFIYITSPTNQAFLIPGSVHFISKKEIQKFSYSDPTKFLQAVPGVYLRDEDGYGLRPNIGLRGVAPSRSKKIVLMEDGVPIAPAPYSAPAAYFFPNIMKTHSIEIFKGVSSVRYGPNSIGGAINFVTNPIPRKPTTEVSASYGLINKYEVLTGGQKGRYGYLFEYNGIASDGFKKLPNGESTGFKKNDFMFKANYRRTHQKLNLKISHSNENSHETYLGLTDKDFSKSSYSRYAASANDLMRWRHQQYQLGYSFFGIKNAELSATMYYHKFNRNWSKFSGFNNGVHTSHYLNPNSKFFDLHFLRLLRGEDDSVLANGEDDLIIRNNHRKYQNGGITLKSSFILKQSKQTSHRLLAELRSHQEQVKRLDTKDSFKMIKGRLAPSGPRIPTTQVLDSVQATSLFLEDEVSFSNGLITSVSVRLEDINTTRKKGEAVTPNHYQIIAPGLGLQYSPQKSWNIIAGVSRGISAASPGQKKSIQPEESINYEAGLKYQGLFSGQLIAFYNDYKNIKGFCSFSSGCKEENLNREFNGGKARIYGLEASLKKKFRLFSLYFPIDFSYTKTMAHFLNKAESVNREWGLGTLRRGDPLPYVPKNKVSLTMGVELKKTSTSFIYNWQSLTYDQSVQEGQRVIGAYGIIDWIAKYSYSQKGEFFFRIDNLLAKEYIASLRPFGARPGKPQSFSLGLRQTF